MKAYGQKLWVHIIISLLLLVLISWAAGSYLRSYTHHGKTTLVPKLIGLNEQEALSKLEEQGLLYEISDSVFDNNFPKGTIVEQLPAEKSLVKHNRTIYLTVNALSTRLVPMPEVTDISISQAEATLMSYGLKVGHLSYEPSECEGCVLRATYQNKRIDHKTKVPYGAKINLVLGQASTGKMIQTPDLINLTMQQAEERVQSLFLTKVPISYVHCSTQADSSLAIIQYQNPIAGEQIKEGSTISIWLSCP